MVDFGQVSGCHWAVSKAFSHSVREPSFNPTRCVQDSNHFPTLSPKGLWGWGKRLSSLLRSQYKVFGGFGFRLEHVES